MYVFVISLKGSGLTPAAHKALYVAAHRIHHGSIKAADFSTKEIRGCVHSNKKQISVGSFSGLEFKAELEIDSNGEQRELEITFGIATEVLETSERELLNSQPLVINARRKFNPINN